MCSLLSKKKFALCPCTHTCHCTATVNVSGPLGLGALGRPAHDNDSRSTYHRFARDRFPKSCKSKKCKQEWTPQNFLSIRKWGAAPFAAVFSSFRGPSGKYIICAPHLYLCNRPPRASGGALFGKMTQQHDSPHAAFEEGEEAPLIRLIAKLAQHHERLHHLFRAAHDRA